MKAEKSLFRRVGVAAAVLLAAGGTSWAVNFISDISAPIQYDSGNWYAYAKFAGGATWDTAEALVNALPAYNGLAPQLATFPTTAQYNWFVSQESNFTSPTIGGWDVAWIGAKNVSGTTYRMDGWQWKHPRGFGTLEC